VLDVYADLIPMRHLVDKVRHRAALRLATVSKEHPLFDAVANAAKRYVKRHRTTLHDLLHEFKIKPEKLEKIKAVRYSAERQRAMESVHRRVGN